MESLDAIAFASFSVMAFLLGSVPFGVFIAKALGVKNIQEHGSHNIGATNVTRVIGLWPGGVSTLLLDLLKGTIAVIVPSKLGLEWLGIVGLEFSTSQHWFFGLAAVTGHCYSPWLKFNGGKGVSTGLGALLVLTPFASLGGILAFIVTYMMYRIGALASLVGTSVIVAIHVTTQPFGVYWFVGLAIGWVILLRHEQNLDRLLLGGDHAV